MKLSTLINETTEVIDALTAKENAQTIFGRGRMAELPPGEYVMRLMGDGSLVLSQDGNEISRLDVRSQKIRNDVSQAFKHPFHWG